MTTLNDQRVIAIEDLYYDENVVKHYTRIDQSTRGFVRDELFEVGEKRIQSMDEARIDVQILLHGAPSTHRLDVGTGIPVVRAANDRLKEICDAHPERLMGFAQLPAAHPRGRRQTSCLGASMNWVSKAQ